MSFIEKIFKKPLVENFDFASCSGPVSEANYNPKVDAGQCAYAGRTGCQTDGGLVFPQRQNTCTNTVPGGENYHVLQSGNYIGRTMFGACACPCTNSADCNGRATFWLQKKSPNHRLFRHWHRVTSVAFLTDSVRNSVRLLTFLGMKIAFARPFPWPRAHPHSVVRILYASKFSSFLFAL